MIGVAGGGVLAASLGWRQHQRRSACMSHMEETVCTWGV